MGKVCTAISWCRQVSTLKLSVRDGFSDAAAWAAMCGEVMVPWQWRRVEEEGEIGSGP